MLNTILASLCSLMILIIFAAYVKDLYWPSDEIKEKRAAKKAAEEAADQSGTFYGINPYRYELTAKLGALAIGLTLLSAFALQAGINASSARDIFFGTVIAAATVYFYYILGSVVKSCWRECERRVSTGIPVDED
jgi:hypothetical protein